VSLSAQMIALMERIQRAQMMAPRTKPPSQAKRRKLARRTGRAR